VNQYAVFQYIYISKKQTVLIRITKEFLQNFLANNTIELQCTQAKLCIPIIDRIYRKMYIGIKFIGIKVDNGLICDGHHRYVASLLADFSIERIPAIRTSATIVTEWSSIQLIEDDWDTSAKIFMLNEQDALFNKIPIEQLDELLK
jgi:hypothetical protein